MFPNPTAAGASISLDVPPSSSADLRIYAVSGRLVRTLRPRLSSGERIVHWDGRDESGVALPSGKYIVQLRNEDTTETRTLILIR